MGIGVFQTNLVFEKKQDISQQGKNSNVFLAHDVQLNGEIVVKQVRKEKLEVADYHKEARILYASIHNNVVSVNYGCFDDEHVYIAMPYYKNGSIKNLINSRYLTVREVVRYGIQFLSGLNHIHAKGLLHFDVKPDNILLSNADEALLSDFGLSKKMKLNGFAELETGYSKHVPPEYFNRTEFSWNYDIYAAGVTLYRMINGDEKFYKAFDDIKNDRNILKHNIINGKFPDRKEYLVHVPNSLKRVINKAMDVNPLNRHKSVLELINELSTIDKNLDWSYQERPDSRTWTLKTEDRMIVLYLTSNGTIFELKASKTILLSGRETRISKYCQAGLNQTQAKKLLNDAFEEYQ